MALTIADVRARVETDFADSVLTRILTSNQQAVERSAGNASEETRSFLALGAEYIPLPRPALSITSVSERASAGVDAVALASDDYRLFGSFRLYRLGDGTNPRSTWGAEVVVVFVPSADAELRERVILDLCQVDIEFRAVDSEEVGDYKQTQKDYRARRRELLAQIREGQSPIV